MGFQDKLRAIRRRRGLTQAQVADRIGVTPVTVGNWERGVNQPTVDILARLADLLQVSTDFLADRDVIPFPDLEDQGTRTLLKNYQRLDYHGRRAVEAICAVELERMEAAEETQQTKRAGERYIPLYTSPSAAGIAIPLDGSDFEMISASTAPEAADFAVRIAGDSMAPYIQDGSTVFVRAGTELENGDVGIFSVNGEMYCKQYLVDGARNLHLKSANPERRDMDVYVPADSDDTVEVLGKVLGVKVPV